MVLPSPGLLNRTNRPAWGNPYNPYVGAGGADPAAAAVDPAAADPGMLFNPYMATPPGPPPGIDSPSSGGGGYVPDIISGSPDPGPAPAPVVDDTTTGSTTGKDSAVLAAFKTRAKPAKGRFESLQAGGAKDAIGPWTALGNLMQFGRGNAGELQYNKEEAAYEQEPYDYLRKALAGGQTIDEALKTSPYPDLFKVWLAREQAAVKQVPNSYDEYKLTVPPGQVASAEGYQKFLNNQNAGKAAKFVTNTGAVLPAPPTGQVYKMNPDGTTWIDPDPKSPSFGLPLAVDLPGSKAAKSAKAGEVTKAKYDRITSDDIGISLDAIARNPDDIFGARGALGAAKTRLTGIPSERGKLNERLSTIKSSITIERINEIRAASTTGGALGQVSDAEGKLLGDAMGSLNPDIGPADLTYNLWRLQVTKNLLENPPTGADGKPREVTSEDVQNAIPKSVRDGVRGGDKAAAPAGGDDLSKATEDDVLKEIERRKGLKK
jgi:hypothetical protein